MNKLIGKLYQAMGGLAVALVASTSQAANGVLENQIQQNWQESGLKVSLPGGAGSEVQLGDLYQVLVTAKSEGHLYLVQQNSHERANGKVRITEVKNKIPGYSGGNAFMYPAVESLQAKPPLGTAAVSAIYTSVPLDIAALRVHEEGSDEYLLTMEQLTKIVGEAQKTDSAMRVAINSLTYEVAVSEGDLEYTTRGIARQINSAITNEDLNNEGGVLTSFDAHIQFEFGSAVPTYDGRLQLDAFGDVLTRDGFDEINFVVAGHTDDIGTREFNLELSEARARAVAEYLENNYGVKSTRMIVEAFGEDMPYADNGSTESRALNRRVEFTLLNETRKDQ